jgi:diaminopimelate epimerase
VDGIAFAKGHGTGNDFVIVPDLSDVLTLSSDRVQALCDRRFGLGGDGILRVAPPTDQGSNAQFFMDYRNSDGSVAQMCGNGIRVFARYLVMTGLAEAGPLKIQTLAGTLDVDCPEQGDVRVDMGKATQPLARAIPIVEMGERTWSAVGVLVPNPHAVVFVDSLEEVGDLSTPPTVSSAIFPEGANVEFVVHMNDQHVSMRVHERGVGETLSCGTGACAAAWAHRRRQGTAVSGVIQVDVPGGSLFVDESDDGSITLIGPAEIIAMGYLSPQWWAAHP